MPDPACTIHRNLNDQPEIHEETKERAQGSGEGTISPTRGIQNHRHSNIRVGDVSEREVGEIRKSTGIRDIGHEDQSVRLSNAATKSRTAATGEICRGSDTLIKDKPADPAPHMA